MLASLCRLCDLDCDVAGCFTSAESMIEAAPRLRPEAVVLDLMMPGMNGLQACVRLRELFPAVRVVIVTALADPDIAQEALSLGASAYLSKSDLTLELLPAILGNA